MGEMAWDPELRLSLGRSADVKSDSSGRSGSVEEPFSATSTQQQQQKQITILYNGRICVCDVTELQARSIISMAKRETDAEVDKNSGRRQQSTQISSTPGAAVPSSSPAALQVQQLLNPSGMSMKRSLQRFLEKRKTRADAVSPYSHQRSFFSLIKS